MGVPGISSLLRIHPLCTCGFMCVPTLSSSPLCVPRSTLPPSPAEAVPASPTPAVTTPSESSECSQHSPFIYTIRIIIHACVCTSVQVCATYTYMYICIYCTYPLVVQYAGVHVQCMYIHVMCIYVACLCACARCVGMHACVVYCWCLCCGCAHCP